ncbi:amidohydrolase family protein [Agreia sp. PsM10]|uniref:amidohydrolase family protein n=1 Tax=Agreia sp. PsM10 TaxID=3030533 RepID=UPI00263B8424|nr:amidohydrolase family protein [Agreia sp. PsM10]MDN4640851.1 amidohydrolase family protein [Agreia sp. PsM10]
MNRQDERKSQENAENSRESPADQEPHAPETTKKRGSNRRTFLKRAGVGAALVGLGIAADETVRRSTAPVVSARTAVTTADGVRIDDVTVIDPTDGSRRAGQSIVVREGRIVDVLPISSIPAEASMRVIDGAGRFAVPGYNDMHTHVLQSPIAELGFALMLAQGVTGIRQMEGSPELLANRAENRLGLNEKAPRLLQMPGSLLLPFNARSVEDARLEIARQWDQGADFIKMVLTDREVFFAVIDAAHTRGMRIAGHLPPVVRIDRAAESGFDSLEHLGTGSSVFLTLSSKADELWAQTPTELPFPSWATGIPFAGWAFDTFLKKNFLGPATSTTDADQLALLKHAFATYSEDRAARLAHTFVEKQTWNTPTMANIRSKYVLDDPEFLEDPWLQRLPAAEKEEHLAAVEAFGSTPRADLDILHEYYERVLQTVGIWANEGAPIMTGTDGNGRGVGNSFAIEFRELGRAGLTPLQVLQATTSAPARYLDRTDRMGRVAPGMDADLLLLDADPLASIEGLSSISLVMRDGHDYTSAELNARVDELIAAHV